MLIDPNTYLNIKTAATTQVYSGPCSLEAIVINTPANGTITIIDDVSGNTSTIATIAANTPAGFYRYNVRCAKVIRIITAATTDITVVFRD